MEETGKLGLGVLRYSENEIVCLVDSQSNGMNSVELTGIDRLVPIVSTTDQALSLGADVLVLGIAPPGGLIPENWFPAIDRAASCGMSIVNGLHQAISGRYPELLPKQFIWDVRTEPRGIGVGTAAARLLSNRRVLMVGTDMSVGKMTAGLEIWKCAKARGINTNFVATGQTGIIITGSGVPLDAIRLDYASGAIESEVCKYPDSDLVIVEGQGSLIHPGSSATLPLMRGSCPTHLVLCHRSGMHTLPRLSWVKVPPLRDYIQLVEGLTSACGVYPEAKVCALALNTSHLTELEARNSIAEHHQELGIPVTDPVRFGATLLLDALLVH